MPLPPALTAEQRQAALEKAAEARRTRAEVKAKLKQGSLGLGELFDQGTRDDALAKLKVVSVLESLPGVGKVQARRIMEELDIKGALKVREAFPDAVLVFVKPPSPDELRRRLAARGTESPADLERRLA